MKTIIFTVAAAKQFDALPADIREAVAGALDGYVLNGQGDVKRLVGRAGTRLRVGRYRVLFDEDHDRVLVVHVGKRETTTCARH